ncbi:MAG: penicillin-binding protein 1C [Lysobacterales bacterium]
MPRTRRWTRTRRWLRRIAFVAVGLLAIAFTLDRLYPLPLPPADGGSTWVLARDGTPLRIFPDRNGIWRYPANLDTVSPLYIDALLTYEDRWFWRHPGVNPVALVRAGVQWIHSGRIVSGGSTLTMQVARILDPQPRSIAGKLRQILRAVQLEAHLSKREILTLYLDHAPFGGTLEGVEAASWAYLGKPAAQLSHAEAALLAVLPQAPSRLRPDRHPTAARAARDKLLQRMADTGTWSLAAVRDAELEPVTARTLVPPMTAPLLAERLHEAKPRRRRIRTTIDAGLQRALEARVAGYVAQLPKRTSAALLVVDNGTLAARAYVGSAVFADDARLGHVDMVRAWRSPGSTLKPFLYGLALDDGLIDSESLLVDAPQPFGNYRPADFDHAFRGPVSAADALRQSLNVPAVDLLDRVGPARFAARLENAGLTLRLPRGVSPNLSIILGGTGARLEDLAGAYASLARGGIAGRVRLDEDDPEIDRRVLSPGAAWIVRAILDANPRPGEASDTFDPGTRPDVAWKTGTSYGFRDAWAIGVTQAFTVAVWVGRPDGTPQPGQYGAVTALPLMFRAIDGLPRHPIAPTPDAPPASVTEADVCWPLGMAADATPPSLCHERRHAYVLDGVIPPTFPDRDAQSWRSGLVTVRVDPATGQRLGPACRIAHEKTVAIARWPVLATSWLPPSIRHRQQLPPLAPGCPDDGLDAPPALHIEGVADGAVIARAPNSAHPPSLSLRAIGTRQSVLWLIDGRLAGKTTSGAAFRHAFDSPGDRTITALTDSGASVEVRVRVVR